MWYCKGLLIAALFLVLSARFALPMQGLFANFGFARDQLAQYSRGSTKTVTMKIPELKPVRKQTLPDVVTPGRAGPKGKTGVFKGVGTRRVLSKSGPVGPVGPKIYGHRRKIKVGSDRYEITRPKRPKRPWSRRRPTKPKPRLTFKKQVRTYRQRRTPSNKFLEAMNVIERGIAEANAAAQSGIPLRYNAKTLTDIRDKIVFAASKRSYQISRALLGKALWLIKHNSDSRNGRRGKRAIQTTVSNFMGQLKSSMEAKKRGLFDEFMAVHGEVTLMFAIDTTGSMGEEIHTAKKIAVDVINHPRQNPVNYILSPFNDPTTGPVIFRDITQGAKFVTDIVALRATGGNDCPELAFKGIFDALLEGPDWGSPMYVFTDAPPKDATPDNMEEVKALAEHLGVTINFFTTGLCRHRNGPAHISQNSFKKVASATSGQMLTLSNQLELEKLTALTGSVLGGSNIISAGTNSRFRKRRAAGKTRYRIKVDDTMEQMSVCVTTTAANQNRGIALKNPAGVTVTSGKTSLSKVSVYQISNPTSGSWTLEIPSTVDHEYFVKSTSDTNIDFEHYFLFQFLGRRRKRTEVPMSHPLKGRPVKLVITIAGIEKVNKQGLALELITPEGTHLRNVAVSPAQGSTQHYITTFTPPSRPFKLRLKGNTKTGNSFERISRNTIEPKTVILRALDSASDYTLAPGKRVSILFYVFATKHVRFSVRVRDKKNFVIKEASRRLRSARPGRKSFIQTRFRAPPGTSVGTTDTVLVTLSVEGSNEKVSQALQLIVL